MKTNERRKVRGFTLIELTVVLLVLVALAGIMVPLLTGYLERSHNGAAAANISEITKQVELYKVKTLKGYPDGWDSLCQSSALWTSTSTPYGVPVNAAALLKAQALTATEAQALNDAGITKLWDFTGFALNAQSATFDTPTTSVAVDPAGTLPTVAMIDPAQFTGTALAETVPNADFSTYDYVLFGLGNRCTAVGSVMVEAPVHFDTIDPAVFYQHYGVIFAVPKSNVSGIVKLVSVVGIHDGGLSGMHDHIKEYMKTVNADK